MKPTRTPRKEKSYKNENFIEMILDIINQNVQEALNQFQDNKTKNMRKHRKK
jgi:hypothetical protein